MTVSNIAKVAFNFLLCFILYFWLTVAIHEWIHLSVLRSLGGDGYIMRTWYGGATVFTATPHSWLGVSGWAWTAFAGGIGVALIYSLLALENWFEASAEEFVSLMPIIGAQLFYGVYEGLFEASLPQSAYLYYANFVVFSGFIAGFFVPVQWYSKWTCPILLLFRKFTE